MRFLPKFECLVDFPIPKFEVLLISTGVAWLKVVKEKKSYLTFCMWQPYKRNILPAFSVNFVLNLNCYYRERVWGN